MQWAAEGRQDSCRSSGSALPREQAAVLCAPAFPFKAAAESSTCRLGNWCVRGVPQPLANCNVYTGWATCAHLTFPAPHGWLGELVSLRLSRVCLARFLPGGIQPFSWGFEVQVLRTFCASTPSGYLCLHPETRTLKSIFLLHFSAYPLLLSLGQCGLSQCPRPQQYLQSVPYTAAAACVVPGTALETYPWDSCWTPVSGSVLPVPSSSSSAL